MQLTPTSPYEQVESAAVAPERAQPPAVAENHVDAADIHVTHMSKTESQP